MAPRLFSSPRSWACIALVLCLAVIAAPSAAVTLTPGSSGTASIANGDPVYVNGIATGHPSTGLQVWLVGKNTAKVSTIQVNADNSYSYELKSADTQNLASGQYLVIVQHPMMNGQFDIVYSAADGKVINRQLGNGMTIFQLTSAGSLQTTDAATALMEAIGSQNIDDTFATASFYVSPPDALVKPVGDHRVGDKFTISGTTNLAVGDKLQVDVYSSSFKPTTKSQSGEYSGASGVVAVVTGDSGRNTWSFDVDASGFRPDEYIVKVAGITEDVTGSATFNILAAFPTTTAAPATMITSLPVPSVITSVPVTTIAPATVPTTRQAALPVGICTCGLLAALGIRKIGKRER